MRSNQIRDYFMDTNMHLNHSGLRATAQERGLSLDDLESGEFVLFINRPFTAFKLVGAGNTFAYHRNRDERALDPRALLLAIERFDGTKLDYRSALAETLFKKLPENVQRAINRDRARAEKRDEAVATIPRVPKDEQLKAARKARKQKVLKRKKPRRRSK